MNGKILLTVVGVAVIIAAILLFQGNGDTEDGTSTQDKATTQSEDTQSDDAVNESDNGSGDQMTEEDTMSDDGSEDQDSDTPGSGEVVIIYSDDGYSPETITIEAGTTVVFRNESSGLMWTASAVHPTHEILPEFDPREAVAIGETYSFTFDEEGTWRYHNHVKAQHTGEVIVK